MRRLALVLAALVALAGGARARAIGKASQLTVAVAASVRPAARELAEAFVAESGVQAVSVSPGASGALFAQIESGAPIDVFLSADRNLPRRLAQAGLGAPEVVYALGRLVVWKPRGSPLALGRDGLAALAGAGVRKIAIANPAVAPYGRAALEALRAAGVLEAVRARLVLGESVAQAAQFAASGAADAAILPASLASEPPLSEGKAVAIPPELHAPIEHAAIVLARARDPEAARAFLAFVTGPAGREILRRRGFEVP